MKVQAIINKNKSHICTFYNGEFPEKGYAAAFLVYGKNFFNGLIN